jgi:hypothetical protein
MNIDKNQIIKLLRSQGKDDQASQAGGELPDQVDTDNAGDATLLTKYGISPGDLKGTLGDLGKVRQFGH